MRVMANNPPAQTQLHTPAMDRHHPTTLSSHRILFSRAASPSRRRHHHRHRHPDAEPPQSASKVGEVDSVVDIAPLAVVWTYPSGTAGAARTTMSTGGRAEIATQQTRTPAQSWSKSHHRVRTCCQLNPRRSPPPNVDATNDDHDDDYEPRCHLHYHRCWTMMMMRMTMSTTSRRDIRKRGNGTRVGDCAVRE